MADEEWDPETSNLHQHAKRELELAGFFDTDGMYGDMLGVAILELVDTFAKQGHSGMSGSIVLQVLPVVLDFKNLSPLTFKPDEWNLVSEGGDERGPRYQNRRKSSVFSDDELQTWYDIDEGDYPHPRHKIEVTA